MRRFFIQPESIEKNTAILRGEDARHIAKVLRLKPGDDVELVDGRGGKYAAVIQEVSRNSVRVFLGAKTISATDSPLAITIAQGYLKDRKMDRLVRQLTELGIAAWIPFFAIRSVPRPDPGKLASRKKRWEKIAREVVKQCNRGQLPEISDATSFESVLKTAASHDLKLLFWECAETRIETPERYEPDSSPRSAIVVIGPEGGLTEEEANAAQSAGFQPATLGPRILRAETAAVAACTIVQYLFGDLSGKSP